MPKKYYWIKLSQAFFQSKEIKKLRRIAGGDTYVIIYLKMQLISLETGGRLYYDGIEDDFAEELALSLDEDVNNIRMTLAFMQKCGLIEKRSEEEYFLPEVLRNFGAETDAARRMRSMRERNKVTIERNNVTPMLQDRYTDIDKDIDKDIDIELEKEIESEKEIEAGEPSSTPALAEKKSKRFVKPTVEEVRAYCKARQSCIDADYFFDYYEANGWKVGGKGAMKDWKAAVRNWERREELYGTRKNSSTNNSQNVDKYKEFINNF